MPGLCSAAQRRNWFTERPGRPARPLFGRGERGSGEERSSASARAGRGRFRRDRGPVTTTTTSPRNGMLGTGSTFAYPWAGGTDPDRGCRKTFARENALGGALGQVTEPLRRRDDRPCDGAIGREGRRSSISFAEGRPAPRRARSPGLVSGKKKEEDRRRVGGESRGSS